MLYRKLIMALCGERGSILVAAIAFAIIMAIAGGGLLMLAGNGVNHEQAALDNDKAFAAAETGMRIGLRWLADSANWAGWDRNPKTIHTFSMDGIDVTALLDDSSGCTRLRSHATCPAMNYIKEISCLVERASASSRVLFNGLDNVNGLDNIWFDGPVHSNEPILLAASSYPPGTKRGPLYFVNGPVTVTNVGIPGFNYGTGPSGNNYNYGIQIDGLTGDGTQGDELDAYFDNTFTHSQDALAVPSFNLTGITPLPQNHSTTQRAVLYFYTDLGGTVGRARYYYTNEGGTRVVHTIPDIHNQIIRVQNNVSVLGVVKGNATVVTDDDCTIYPVGDLTYASFDRSNADMRNECANYDNRNNYHIPLDDPNCLALVSGGDIHFDQANQMNMSNPATGDLVPSTSTTPTMWITASLIAARPGRGIIWNTTPGGTIDLPYYHPNLNIRAIGSRCVNTFFNYTRDAAAANDRFRFFFDRRLLGTISAPGIPSIRRNIGGGNDLYLLKTDWRENNIPKP